MAPVLSFPSLCLRSPARLRLPAHFCPPSDPPPRLSPLMPLETLFPPQPPEPPDPPGAFTNLVFLVLSDTPFTLFHKQHPQMPDRESPFPIPASLTRDGVVPFVTTDYTRFFSKDLYPAVCSMFPPLPFTLVRLYSSISVCSHVDWYEMIVVWVSPNIWFMVLNCNVPVTFGLFGSDLVPVRGFHVALVRHSTAFERKLTIWLLQLNMIMGGFQYPVASFVKLFFFPIFPFIWSKLDVQASLVLQGTSSWLMLCSASVAAFVTFQVTRGFDVFSLGGVKLF
ncbi:hypothetical protein DY000_02057099 [Brassica cretica]|uniref:Protein TIC 20 n=1 Tax=Brassica cretica TaxID=69181 RepID=A0ABQ7AAA9_BRACR|nr:hypothetical protein DY000_02057099 [Brassica cretica]